VKVKPATEQPTAPGNSPTPPTNSQANKRKIPAKEKPAATERSGKSPNKQQQKKKGEEQETQPAAVPGRSPQ